jgi:hypothetical protein
MASIAAASGFVDKHTFIVGLGTTMPLSNPENRAFYRQDRRMALYHNDDGSSASKGDDTSNSNSLKAAFLAQKIRRKLFAFLLRSKEET